jgi:cytochrome c oxidase subunit I+III
VAAVDVARLDRIWHEPAGLHAFLTTVNHKKIGVRYMVTAGLFFLAGGIEALIIRTQLAEPRGDVVGPKAYDQLFSMHGVTMIFLFVTPLLSGGFGNYFVPLMIGARDMAFPRLNALSYWIYLASGTFIYSSFLFGQAPSDGWFNYTPLSEKPYTPGLNTDFYDLGLLFLTVSSTVGAINFIVTIFKLRAPGMSINRMPLYAWAMLGTSFSLVFALPALSAANIMLTLERRFGFHFFTPSKGGDELLWQHLFWIFGHPDVYIIFLPAVGIVASIIPTFSRRPMVAYPLVALGTMATAFIGFGVWVHHMFATGLPQVTMTFFAAASLLIAIPSAIQIFAWTATVATGKPVVKSPFLFVLGFVVVFVIGGLSGVMFAVIPFDQQVTDTYFVVAHFHYVLFGGAVFPAVAGLLYWWPKITGRLYNERAAQAAFWLFFVGFNLAFFPMHVLGLLGMPRRTYTYPAGMGWDTYNLLSSIGAFLLAGSLLLIVGMLFASLRRGALAGDDPWGANTLEWATSSPPPEYNFPTIPVVRSANPNWDGPEFSDLALAEGHQALATTELDAYTAKVLEMPSSSSWPLLLALSLAFAFTAFLIGHYILAGVGAALVAASLTGWFSQEPIQE